MRTIGYRRSHRSPPGDVIRLCSYCGVAYYRSQLRRDASGSLACHDDQHGRDSVTLNEGNAAALASRRLPGQTGMPTDGTVDSPSTDVAPVVSWNGTSAPNPNNVGPTGSLSAQIQFWGQAGTVALGTDGTSVVSWVDKGPYGNSLAPLATTSPPLWTAADASIGGRPTITFSPAASGVRRAVTLPNLMWCWLICKPIAWNSGAFLLTNNVGWSLTQAVGSPSMRINGSLSGTVNSAAVLGQWCRIIARFDPSGVSSLQVHGTVVTDTLNQAGNGGTLIVGSLFSGALAELLITYEQPKPSEIAALDAYGAATYGSSLF